MISKDVINAVTKQIKRETTWYIVIMFIIMVVYAVNVFTKSPFNELVEATYVLLCLTVMSVLHIILKLSNLVKSIGNSLCEDKKHIEEVSEMKVN